MENHGFINFNPDKVPDPSFVIDRALIRRNGKLLHQVAEKSGAKVLMALKAFSMFSVFDELKPFLNGCCASSPHEARLGREEFGGEVHSYAAAFNEDQLKEFLSYSDHIIFNSLSLRDRFEPLIRKNKRPVSYGLRINPRHREGEVEIYDPSAPFSRLGAPISELKGKSLEGIEGFHIHNLCEQNFDALERTWKAVEADLEPLLAEVKWLNLGGGHHITRADYNRKGLIDFIRFLKDKYDCEIYLEPGEAVALNAGILTAKVLDLIRNERDIAILNTSVPCHMPDVLEMPYRPHIIGSGKLNEKNHNYRIGGVSCLAGDVAGDYSFDQALEIGQSLIFTDMAIYSMVKTSTFNGIHLPAICTYDSDNGEYEIIKEFGYEDFKGRLS